jgi:hypothetical protein
VNILDFDLFYILAIFLKRFVTLCLFFTICKILTGSAARQKMLQLYLKNFSFCNNDDTVNPMFGVTQSRVAGATGRHGPDVTPGVAPACV